MEVLYSSCCGLDVHKKTVVACCISDGQKSLRSFETTTGALYELRDWLLSQGCTHVAMESTGSYWKPVYNLLESHFSLVVANAHDVKIVPGRKSDAKDAEWIADLLRHGLLRPSFIPSREDRELRELTRYRQSLVSERSAEVNRIQKVLEGANIKLSSVATNVVGQSGMAVLQGIVAGILDSAALARLTNGRLHASPEEIEKALLGSVHAHQRFLLKQQVRHIAELDALIAEVSEEVKRREAPFLEARANLMTIPGVGPRVVEVILSELGPSVARFPTPGHLTSWVGLSPGLNESAGKRLSARTTKGNSSLRVAMVQAAHASARTTTHVGARYRSLRTRLGGKKTAIAIARSILIAVYAVLRDNLPFHDLGVSYLVDDPKHRAEHHLRQLQRLGYDVSIHSAPAA